MGGHSTGTCEKHGTDMIDGQCQLCYAERCPNNDPQMGQPTIELVERGVRNTDKQMIIEVMRWRRMSFERAVNMLKISPWVVRMARVHMALKRGGQPNDG